MIKRPIFSKTGFPVPNKVIEISGLNTPTEY